MKKNTSYGFEHNYKVRTHLFFLVLNFFIVAIFFSLAGILLSVTFFGNEFLNGNLEIPLYVFVVFLFAGLFTISYLLLRWDYHYHVVSPQSISTNSGIIFRNTHSIDVPSIRSISVSQGLVGRIFGFGTLTFESPLLKNDFLLKRLPSPFKHASLVEKARLETINKFGPENIIIAQ